MDDYLSSYRPKGANSLGQYEETKKDTNYRILFIKGCFRHQIHEIENRTIVSRSGDRREW